MLLFDILAAAGDVTPGWIGEAAFGAIVLLALGGFIWFKPAVDQIISRLTSAEIQRDTLLEVYRTEMLPALNASTHGTARTADVLERIVPLLEQFAKTPPPDRFAK